MSSFGILLGSLSVFTIKLVKSPLLWLRIGALLLLLVWVIPFSNSSAGSIGDTLRVSLVMIPMSFGWAAGDVSLARYLYLILAEEESYDQDVSVLGSVMSFLYISHIFLYLVLSISLGVFIDREFPVDAQKALIFVGGTQLTVIAVVVLVSTFIPLGALKLNPDLGVSEDEVQENPGSVKLQRAASRYTAIFTSSGVKEESQPTKSGESKKGKALVLSKLVGSSQEI